MRTATQFGLAKLAGRDELRRNRTQRRSAEPSDVGTGDRVA